MKILCTKWELPNRVGHHGYKSKSQDSQLTQTDAFASKTETCMHQNQKNSQNQQKNILCLLLIREMDQGITHLAWKNRLETLTG